MCDRKDDATSVIYAFLDCRSDLYMVTYTMFSKQAALAFSVAFLTHILLDLPNCKGIQLFWPIPGHHCFKLCASNGWVNRILCLVGTVMAINLFTGFAGISIFNWIIKK